MHNFTQMFMCVCLCGNEITIGTEKKKGGMSPADVSFTPLQYLKWSLTGNHCHSCHGFPQGMPHLQTAVHALHYFRIESQNMLSWKGPSGSLGPKNSVWKFLLQCTQISKGQGGCLFILMQAPFEAELLHFLEESLSIWRSHCPSHLTHARAWQERGTTGFIPLVVMNITNITIQTGITNSFTRSALNAEIPEQGQHLLGHGEAVQVCKTDRFCLGRSVLSP